MIEYRSIPLFIPCNTIYIVKNRNKNVNKVVSIGFAIKLLKTTEKFTSLFVSCPVIDNKK